MKKLFTLSLLALFTTQISFAQDPGFYPPEGSTFNSDSSEISLPDAMIDVLYNETISFYASDSITIDVAGVAMSLPFVSAVITNVSTPAGMDYSCNVEACAFTSNTWGEVTLTGTPETVGLYSLDLTAVVTIDATPLGLPMDVTFPIPYDGSNPILNFALGDDYSAINSFVPSFLLNVTPYVGVEEIAALADVSVYPNPSTTDITFEFASSNEDVQVQIFDLLGNMVYNSSYNREAVTVNTSNFTNGVYIYKLATVNESSTGRLIVNK